MVLIIGGAGYIGAHLNKLLHENGYETIVLDNLTHGHSEFVKWGTFIQGDIEDEKLISSIFDNYLIDLVIYQAEYRLNQPERSERHYTNQILSIVKLLDVLIDNKKFKTKKIIFASTNEVYGIPQKIPIAEDHELQPIHPNGDSRRIVENILEDYQESHGFNFVIFRYFGVAGADYEAGIGEAHLPETHLIPSLLDVALGYRDKIVIFGNDYDTPDGTCIRDYIHVIDLAQAHILAYEKILKKGNSTHLNICSGVGYSVRQIVDKVREITKSDIHVIEGQKRRGDVASMIGDPTKIENVLDWKREVSDIDNIIQTAWEWQKIIRKL